jgi:uncharacterized protein
MSAAPANHVNAKELAARTAVVERSLQLSEMPGLAEAGALEGTNVQAVLRFGNFEGQTAVELRVQGVLVLVCQRCLKPCSCALDESAQLAVVESGDEELLGSHEPLVGNPERLSLQALIEEQVLLGMPLVPMHDESTPCGAAAGARELTGEPVMSRMEDKDKQTPFANLRLLLGTDGQDTASGE